MDTARSVSSFLSILLPISAMRPMRAYLREVLKSRGGMVSSFPVETSSIVHHPELIIMYAYFISFGYIPTILFVYVVACLIKFGSIRGDAFHILPSILFFLVNLFWTRSYIILIAYLVTSVLSIKEFCDYNGLKLQDYPKYIILLIRLNYSMWKHRDIIMTNKTFKVDYLFDKDFNLVGVPLTNSNTTMTYDNNFYISKGEGETINLYTITGTLIKFHESEYTKFKLHGVTQYFQYELNNKSDLNILKDPDHSLNFFSFAIYDRYCLNFTKIVLTRVVGDGDLSNYNRKISPTPYMMMSDYIRFKRKVIDRKFVPIVEEIVEESDEDEI